MTYVALLFCILFSYLHLEAYSYLETFTREHESCIISISNGSLESQVCTEASYMTYVRKELPQASGYKLSILESIHNLYDDLALKRKPTIIVEGDNVNKTLKIFPIVFAIPEQFVSQTIPPKEKGFGKVIPGNKETYFALPEDTLYREDMGRSLFTLTYKKNGWDCLRHVEILAAGSLPQFLDIRLCPNQTLAFHPKQLYSLLLDFPGVKVDGKRVDKMMYAFNALEVNMTAIDRMLYMATVSALLQYTRNVLTTKAIASYVLDTIVQQQRENGIINASLPKSIFYLTHQDHDMDKGDYMTDMLLHGLKTIMGPAAVVDFPERAGLYKTQAEFNESSEYYPRRSALYGGGTSWGLLLDDWGKHNDMRNYATIDRNIETRAYDLVILGSGHRDGWAARLHFWDLVCKHYKPFEVAFVDGADLHLQQKMIHKYAKCAGHMFSREGPPSARIVKS